MRRMLVALALCWLAFPGLAQAKDKPGVYFVEPKNGAVVGQEFKVVMGVRGNEVKPAGDMTPKTGHHHLLIDAKPVKKGDVDPRRRAPPALRQGSDRDHGQARSPASTSCSCNSPTARHHSYGPAMSKTITVTVK